MNTNPQPPQPQPPRPNATTRYLKRRQLQAALTRVIEVLFRNNRAGIKPDKRTALLAVGVMQGLNTFAQGAGMDPATVPPGPALERAGFIIKARKKQTRASKKSRRKAARERRDPGT